MADFEAPFEGTATDLFERLSGDLDGEPSATMFGVVRPRFVLEQRATGWMLRQRALLGERLELTVRDRRDRPDARVLVGRFRRSGQQLATFGIALVLAAQLSVLAQFGPRSSGIGLSGWHKTVLLAIPFVVMITFFGVLIVALVSKARGDRKVMLAVLRDALGLTTPAAFPPSSQPILREIPVRGSLSETLARLRQRLTELGSTRLSARRRRLGLSWVAISRRADCWRVVREHLRHREVGGTLVLASRPPGMVLEFRQLAAAVKPPSRSLAIASSLGLLGLGALCGAYVHWGQSLEVGTSPWLSAKLIALGAGAAAALAGLPLISFGLSTLEVAAERANGAKVRQIFEEVCDEFA